VIATLSASHALVLAVFAGILLAAAYGDVRRLLIPNRFPLALVLLYPAYLLTAPTPVQPLLSLAIALGFFCAGAGLFAAGLMGGGDVKLLAAVALWVEPPHALEFLLLTTLAGAVIGLALLTPQGTHVEAMVQDVGAGWKGAGDDGTTKRRRVMPYGVAIAAAGLIVVLRLFTLMPAA